jgi:hypothetical protein
VTESKVRVRDREVLHNIFEASTGPAGARRACLRLTRLQRTLPAHNTAACYPGPHMLPVNVLRLSDGRCAALGCSCISPAPAGRLEVSAAAA